MLPPDELARLAHRALRLRENGIGSERTIRTMAESFTVPRTDAEDEQTLGAVPGHPLALLARRVHHTLHEDLPGPTDRKTVERLMTASLDDIWKQWDEAVTANLELTLDADDLKAWRASVKRDQAAHEERLALMAGSGEWPVHPAFGHNRHLDGAANALYDLGREGFLDGSIDYDTATIKVALVDSADYAVNLATHQFLSSVAVGGRVATSAALANKTKAAGVADADDVTFSSVTGDPSEAVVIYQASAVGGGADVADTAQRLIGYMDTATGLPVTPNGGNINLVFDSGSNRIFKL